MVGIPYLYEGGWDGEGEGEGSWGSKESKRGGKKKCNNNNIRNVNVLIEHLVICVRHPDYQDFTGCHYSIGLEVASYAHS